MKEKKTNIFREYWYLWLIVAILPFAVYGLIILPFGFNHIGGNNAPTVWLGFWGGYLGAIISAGVAFFILNKQLKANAKENEDNRKENEKQNEANRKLQLKIIEYNRELQNLNNFKYFCIEYIDLFQSNHIMEIANTVITHSPKDAFNYTKTIYINSSSVNTKMGLYVPKTYSKFMETNKEFKTNEFAQFKDVLDDIQEILMHAINKREIDITKLKHSNSNEYLEKCKSKDGTVQISTIIKAYSSDVGQIHTHTDNKFKTYFYIEQERIDKILLD